MLPSTQMVERRNVLGEADAAELARIRRILCLPADAVRKAQKDTSGKVGGSSRGGGGPGIMFLEFGLWPQVGCPPCWSAFSWWGSLSVHCSAPPLVSYQPTTQLTTSNQLPTNQLTNHPGPGGGHQ